jgi:hypothetical protein
MIRPIIKLLGTLKKLLTKDPSNKNKILVVSLNNVAYETNEAIPKLPFKN